MANDQKNDMNVLDRINKAANERHAILRKGNLGATERRRIEEITRELEQLWMERRVELASRHRTGAPNDPERMGL